MNRSYLFVYNDLCGPRATITAILDRMPEVLNWRYDIPNCIYVVSRASAQELADSFRRNGGGAGTWLFAEATANKQGWLSQDTWAFLNDKPSSGRRV